MSKTQVYQSAQYDLGHDHNVLFEISSFALQQEAYRDVTVFGRFASIMRRWDGAM